MRPLPALGMGVLLRRIECPNSDSTRDGSLQPIAGEDGAWLGTRDRARLARFAPAPASVFPLVMAGLLGWFRRQDWMAGSSPVMTRGGAGATIRPGRPGDAG
jgi:hypothetical protein